MHAEEETLSVIEEELVVAKTSVSDGKVVISTRTAVVKELAEIELGGSDVLVERVSIGNVVEDVPQVRIEGDVTIIPVLEERLVVEKRLVLVEEIRVTNSATTRTQRVEAELRKQTAVIERQKPQDPSEENLHG